MKIGPKYKIARRLGAPIFEKTQTQKYALSLARKERSMGKGRRKPKSAFGQELIEKQKARFSYGLSERQLKNYIDRALRSANPTQALFLILESRLDNVILRAGFSKTRAQARQTASHGHVLVNGKRVTVPSLRLVEGDIVELRTGSAGSPLFGEVADRMKIMESPAWLKIDPSSRQATVKGEPVYVPQDSVLDLRTVIEFYNR